MFFFLVLSAPVQLEWIRMLFLGTRSGPFGEILASCILVILSKLFHSGVPWDAEKRASELQLNSSIVYASKPSVGEQSGSHSACIEVQKLCGQHSRASVFNVDLFVCWMHCGPQYTVFSTNALLYNRFRRQKLRLRSMNACAQLVAYSSASQ